jgi:endo-1,3-1,4-beta-glycanase ExoK
MILKNVIALFLVISSISLSAKDYKGAEIYSKDSVLYGKFEMTIQAAHGSGQLSTFFLYRYESETSTTLWEEIDIEIFGKDTNVFQTNVIVEEKEGTRLMTEEEHHTDVNLTTGLHKYVIEWKPDTIRWYLNDVLIRTETEKAKLCNAPMSIRFNHWAANISSWVGTFDTEALPADQVVDYLSYSAYTPGAGDNGSDYTLEWTDNFTNLNSARWGKANWTFGENLCDFSPSNAIIEDEKLLLRITDESPVVLPTAINNIELNFAMYPNPCKGNLTIQFSASDELSIRMCDTYGRIILPKQELTSNTAQKINSLLSQQKNGVYIVQVYKGNMAIRTKKLYHTTH